MSEQRLFSAGETLEWDVRPNDSWLRSKLANGDVPQVPTAVTVTQDKRDHCPVCGSKDLEPGHFSHRIDAPTDGCEWDGQWPHPQIITLQDGSCWSGDWFK